MKLLSRATFLATSFWLLFHTSWTIRAVDSCIDINTASKEGLKEIRHIGDARADQIIKLRPFSSIEDLDRVPGIGPSRISDIKNQSLACVSASPFPPKTESQLPKEIESPPPAEKLFPKEGLAEIKPGGGQTSSSPLWVALVIAIFSGFAILFLKSKVKKNNF
ncbi:MAG: helix-hairpin-helix domain-containing protein [Candidatus Nealsonbacteria bacterium]|nr:helix-hairpin-helix domain-containing protein [Candidatus Nealsonbacteria bacterium]